MLKRAIISLMVLTAFALVQVHNFMPHHHARTEPTHHHHDENGTGHHHHNHHDEKEDDHHSPYDPSDHDAEFGKVLIKPNSPKETLLKVQVWEFIHTSLFEAHIACESPPLTDPPFIKPPLLPSYAYGVPLRAPPFSA
jgi:hypothetical protein